MSSLNQKLIAYVALVVAVPLFLIFALQEGDNGTPLSFYNSRKTQQLRRKLGSSLKLSWVIKNSPSASSSSTNDKTQEEQQKDMIRVGPKRKGNKQSTTMAQSSSFSYNYVLGDALGPDNWHTLVSSSSTTQQNYCNDKQNYVESPINVQHGTITNQCNSVRPLQISHEDTTLSSSESCRYKDISFDITKYGLQLYFLDSSSLCKRPQLLLPNGLGVHWTFTNLQVKLKSEHYVNGRQYDGELQLEHEHTADDPSRTVVSVMLDASGYTPNSLIESLLKRWEQKWMELQQECDGSLNNSINDHGNDDILFPYDQFWKEARLSTAPQQTSTGTTTTTSTSFFQYQGTQTVPPCQSGISWIILEHPIIISKIQFKRLAKLMERYMDPSAGGCQEYPTVASPHGEISRPLPSTRTLGEGSSSSGIPVYYCETPLTS